MTRSRRPPSLEGVGEKECAMAIGILFILVRSCATKCSHVSQGFDLLSMTDEHRNLRKHRVHWVGLGKLHERVR